VANSIKSESSDKPQINIVADITICIWTVIVMVAYFGPLINPILNHAAGQLSPVYALMLISSIIMAALRILRKDRLASSSQQLKPKSRH
jgi:hypothetical protein